MTATIFTLRGAAFRLAPSIGVFLVNISLDDVFVISTPTSINGFRQVQISKRRAKLCLL